MSKIEVKDQDAGYAYLSASILSSLLGRAITLVFWGRLEDVEEHGTAWTDFKNAS